VWVIERAVMEEGDVPEALRTCHMRGWVEPLASAVPAGRLTPAGQPLAAGPAPAAKPLYRLTDSGWGAINRSHQWTVLAAVIAAASFAVSALGLVIALAK
jgi:hypothetical protein